MADRAVPFGVSTGQLVEVGDQLVFVDQRDPNKTFAIQRNNVAEANLVDGVLTIRTSEPIQASTTHSFRVQDTSRIDFAAWARATGPAGVRPQSPLAAGTARRAGPENDLRLEFNVEEERTFSGDETGKLLITDDQIRYTSVTAADRSFTWQYKDVKEFIRKNQNKVKVKSFSGDDHTFTLVGEGISSKEYREIVDLLTEARTGG